MPTEPTRSVDDPKARPWITAESISEIEAWIARLNFELQQLAPTATTRGQGVCLTLVHGGEITMHTTSDGDILLDVDDAEWVSPLIAAATGIAAPRGSYWTIPGDRLIELMMALNSLIATERLVLRHTFHSIRY